MEMKHFQIILKHNEDSLFGDAKCHLHLARQDRLRLPSRLPAEEAVKSLKDYTVGKLKELCSIDTELLTKSQFVELRSLTCSRLTLFNARSGGEPARMKISHWTERAQWVHKTTSDGDQALFPHMEITFVPGKGNKLVFVIVPRECVLALDILVHSVVL